MKENNIKNNVQTNDKTLKTMYCNTCKETTLQVPEMEKGEQMEDMSVFKSYLRRLLQDLKDLKEVLEDGDGDKAKKMVDRLIDDTQKGIEDN